MGHKDALALFVRMVCARARWLDGWTDGHRINHPKQKQTQVSIKMRREERKGSGEHDGSDRTMLSKANAREFKISVVVAADKKLCPTIPAQDPYAYSVEVVLEILR